MRKTVKWGNKSEDFEAVTARDGKTAHVSRHLIPRNDANYDTDQYTVYSAIAAFDDGDPENLKLNAGDFIQVWDEGNADTGLPGEDDWLTGWDQDGREGLVPASYLRRTRRADDGPVERTIDKYGS